MEYSTKKYLSSREKQYTCIFRSRNCAEKDRKQILFMLTRRR